MMKVHAWLILCLSAVASFSAIAAEPFRDFQTPNNCKVRLQQDELTEGSTGIAEVRWSGACKDGYAAGPGVLSYMYDYGESGTAEFTGTMVNGVLDGRTMYREIKRDGASSFDETYKMGCQVPVEAYCVPLKHLQSVSGTSATNTTVRSAKPVAGKSDGSVTRADTSTNPRGSPANGPSGVELAAAGKECLRRLKFNELPNNRVEVGFQNVCEHPINASIPTDDGDFFEISLPGGNPIAPGQKVLVCKAGCEKNDYRLSRYSPTETTSQSSANTEKAISQGTERRAAVMSVQACHEKIVAIHLQGDRERKAAGRDPSMEEAASNRSRQAQLDLFSDQCAHHPQAKSYVRSAQEQLRQSAESHGSSGTLLSASTPPASDYSTANTSTPMSRATNESSGFDATAPKGIRYVGPVTDNCARYKPLKLDTSVGTQWFELSNGCTEPINIWYASLPSGRFSSLTRLNRGEASKSWFSTRGQYAVREIKYFACRQMENGLQVHFDEKKMYCYVRPKS